MLGPRSLTVEERLPGSWEGRQMGWVRAGQAWRAILAFLDPALTTRGRARTHSG